MYVSDIYIVRFYLHVCRTVHIISTARLSWPWRELLHTYSLLKAQQQVGFYNNGLPLPESCLRWSDDSLSHLHLRNDLHSVVRSSLLSRVNPKATPTLLYRGQCQPFSSIGGRGWRQVCLQAASQWRGARLSLCQPRERPPNHRPTKATACLSPSRRVHSHHGGDSAR